MYKRQQLFQFYYDETQVYLANTNSTDPMTLKEPPIAACLKGKELIGSMRGYIWSRTIPILPHYLVLGAGPDCFLYEFPQDDVSVSYTHLDCFAGGTNARCHFGFPADHPSFGSFAIIKA